MWAGDPNNLKTGVGRWDGEDFRHGAEPPGLCKGPGFSQQDPSVLDGSSCGSRQQQIKGPAGRLTAELPPADAQALGKEPSRGLRGKLEWQPLVQPDTPLVCWTPAGFCPHRGIVPTLEDPSYTRYQALRDPLSMCPASLLSVCPASLLSVCLSSIPKHSRDVNLGETSRLIREKGWERGVSGYPGMVSVSSEGALPAPPSLGCLASVFPSVKWVVGAHGSQGAIQL